MANRRFGFALLGAGNMGAVHMQNLLLSARASLKWVVRSRVEEARSFIQSRGLPVQCAAPAELDRVLADPSVDAVVVCSPTDVHENQIQRSLLAGKAVFSEKPVTDALPSTTALYHLAQRQNLPLFCAFHRRFDPSIKRVHSAVSRKEKGTVKLIRSCSHDPAYPSISYIKSSGGIVKDSTIHDLDMSLWMSGSTPKRIQCQGQAFDPEVAKCGDFDLVVATVLFENGSVAVIDNGRKSSQGYDQRLEVLCEKGGYQILNRPQWLTSSLNDDVTHSSPIVSEFVARYSEAYRLELEHFMDVLEGREEMAVTEKDTLSAMRLAEAVTQAAKTGMPVEL